MSDTTMPCRGVMPWDNLIDCSKYNKTQVRLEIAIYKLVPDVTPSLPLTKSKK